MIFNNHRAITFIMEQAQRPLDHQFVIEIHRMMTEKTKAGYCAGDYRKEQTYVQDFIDGEIAHTPPEASRVNGYMTDLITFANQEEPFVHPIVKASIIHFMFGYIHPFMDGNGRTARALFYWFLIKKGYGNIKNISISRSILESRTQYDKAFLKTESDGNDMTYFINYSIKSLRVAVEKLIRHIERSKQKFHEYVEATLKLKSAGLADRQAGSVALFYSDKVETVSVSDYASIHTITRQTAAKDLKELVEMGLLSESQEGREKVYRLKSKEAVEQFIS